MAAPVVSGSFTPSHSNSSVTHTAPVLTGTVAGELLLALITDRLSSATIDMTTVPTGWTLALGPTRNQTNGLNAWAYWKVATGTDGTPAWTANAAAPNSVQVLRITGYNSTTPIGTGSLGATQTVASATLTFPTVVTSGADSLLVCHAGFQAGQTISAWNSPLIQIYSREGGASANLEGSAGGRGTQALLGNSGSLTATIPATVVAVQQTIIVQSPAVATTDIGLSPDAIISQSNLTGVVGAIQDNPNEPDSSWLTTTAVP